MQFSIESDRSSANDGRRFACLRRAAMLVFATFATSCASPATTIGTDAVGKSATELLEAGHVFGKLVLEP